LVNLNTSQQETGWTQPCWSSRW